MVSGVWYEDQRPYDARDIMKSEYGFGFSGHVAAFTEQTQLAWKQTAEEWNHVRAYNQQREKEWAAGRLLALEKQKRKPLSEIKKECEYVLDWSNQVASRVEDLYTAHAYTMEESNETAIDRCYSPLDYYLPGSSSEQMRLWGTSAEAGDEVLEQATSWIFSVRKQKREKEAARLRASTTMAILKKKMEQDLLERRALHSDENIMAEIEREIDLEKEKQTKPNKRKGKGKGKTSVAGAAAKKKNAGPGVSASSSTGRKDDEEDEEKKEQTRRLEEIKTIIEYDSFLIVVVDMPFSSFPKTMQHRYGWAKGEATLDRSVWLSHLVDKAGAANAELTMDQQANELRQFLDDHADPGVSAANASRGELLASAVVGGGHAHGEENENSNETIFLMGYISGDGCYGGLQVRGIYVEGSRSLQ
ncbi:unnamed protein product, partial [Amoebophrya sp. A25]|eukprot:GSA25T00013827001.1